MKRTVTTVLGCSLPGPRAVARAAACWTWDIAPAKV